MNATSPASNFSNNTREEKLPLPTPEVVADVFREKLPSSNVLDDLFGKEGNKLVPRTEKDIIGYSDGDSSMEESDSPKESDDDSLNEDDDQDDDDQDVDEEQDDECNSRIKVKCLPKTIQGLHNSFNKLFIEFTRGGKHEHRNELVFLLDELLSKNGIDNDKYQRLNNIIATSLYKNQDDNAASEEMEQSDHVINAVSKGNVKNASGDALTDHFIQPFKEFACEGKKDLKRNLVILLNELLFKHGVSKDQYN